MLALTLTLLTLLSSPTVGEEFDLTRGVLDDEAVAEWKNYDTYSGREVTEKEAAARKVTAHRDCIIRVRACSPYERRRVDNTCYNVHQPARGSTLTPYLYSAPPTLAPDGARTTAKSGRPLPNARALRVGLLSDGRVGSTRFVHMLTHLLLFLTGDFTSVHDTLNYVGITTTCCAPGGEQDPRCMPVRIPDDDLHLRTSRARCLNLTTLITYQTVGCTSRSLPRERINLFSPVLDLSQVYGGFNDTAQRARARRDGLFRSDLIDGKEWPPTAPGPCLNNVPPLETRCHDIPSPSVNSALGLNLYLIWWYRNHNHLARTISAMNPCWRDERVFTTVKDLNIALWQNLLYYEMWPLLLGYDFLLKSKVIYPTIGHVDDYDPRQPVGVTNEFLATMRWFHTMQEGRTKLYDRQGKIYNELAVVDMLFRTGILAVNRTLQGLTQGAFRQVTAEADTVVDPDMGERVVGRLQLVSDIFVTDTMKARDTGVGSYTTIRRLCGLKVPKDFKDLLDWIPVEQVDVLSRDYETVDDIELYIGLLAESEGWRWGAKVPGYIGSVGGSTLACVLADQLLRWRRTDRFWFEKPDRPGALSKKQLAEVRKWTVAHLLCWNGDEVDKVQPQAFLKAGPGNEMVPCSHLDYPNLEAWKDDKCSSRSQEYDRLNYVGTPVTQDYAEEYKREPLGIYPEVVKAIGGGMGRLEDKKLHFEDGFRYPYESLKEVKSIGEEYQSGKGAFGGRMQHSKEDSCKPYSDWQGYREGAWNFDGIFENY